MCRQRRPAKGLVKGRSWSVLAVVAIYVAAACDVTGLPSGSVRFAAPAQYRAWWALTETCSGLRGDFDKVSWYLDANSETFTIEGASVNGAWYPDGNRIVLGDSEKFDGTLVRHEMLHALLQASAHPRKQFLGNCGDIVACVEQCMTDAGGPPDTSDASPILPAASLPAAIVIAPDTESVSADSGWITVTVTIRNASDAPGRVPLIAGGANTNIDLVWRTTAVNGPSGAAFGNYFTLAPADSVESIRRVVFDEQVTLVKPPRQITFSGSFGPSSTPAQVLTVVP